MLINRSGAMVLPFLGIYLNHELGYSLTQAGIIMTFFGIGSFLGAFFGGILTDRIGFFHVQWISLLGSAIAFYAMIWIEDFYMLCFGVFMISFIADHFRPANWTAMEVFSTPETMVRSVSLIRLAVNLGYAIGPMVGGIVSGLLGYYMLFILNGSSVLIGCIVLVILFRNKQRKVIPKERTSKTQLPWKDKSYVLYLIPFTILITIFLQLVFTIPVFFKSEYGFDEFTIGVLMAINGGLIFLIEMPIIYFFESRKAPRYWVFLGGVFIALSFIALILNVNLLLAAVLFTLLISVGEIISFPFSSTLALNYSNDENRGKYMGLYTMTFSFASIVAPGIGLSFSESYGFDMLWLLSAIIAFISSLLILKIKS